MISCPVSASWSSCRSAKIFVTSFSASLTFSIVFQPISRRLTLKVAQDVFNLREGKHFRLYLTSPKAIDLSPMGLNSPADLAAGHLLQLLGIASPLHRDL